MKKYLFFLLTLLVSFVGVSFSEQFPYQVGNEESVKNVIGTESYGIVEQKDVLKDITEAYVGTDIKEKDSPFIYYVSKVINYFLIILSFIAVVVLLYGFSLVFTDKTEEGIKKGMKYVKMATIAIIVIGISWLFTMWIFSIYNS